MLCLCLFRLLPLNESEDEPEKTFECFVGRAVCRIFLLGFGGAPDVEASSLMLIIGVPYKIYNSQIVVVLAEFLCCL